MSSILKKIDIFGSSVQLSFQHQTNHKTYCGGIFTILLIMTFGVAFWIQGQDVIYKINPETYYNSNDKQASAHDLTEGYFPIAFGLRKSHDSSYIQMNTSNGFEVNVFIEKIDKDNNFIEYIPVSFIECRNLFSQNASTSINENDLTANQQIFKKFIEEKKVSHFLYCIQFKKNQDEVNKYFLQNEFHNLSSLSIQINKCTSIDLKSCLDTKYKLKQLVFDTIYIDNYLSFTDRFSPFEEVVKTQSFTFSSNSEKRITLNFQQTEISTEDSLIFNQVSQINTGLIQTTKSQDFFDFDGDKSILLSVNIQLKENICSYRRYYRKLSSVVAEIGGLSKAIMFIFALVVTPFAKIDFQTSLLNEIFYFEDDDDSKDKKKQEEDETMYPLDSESPANLGNKRLKKMNQQYLTRQNSSYISTAAGINTHTNFGTNTQNIIPHQNQISKLPSIQELKYRIQSSQSHKQDTPTSYQNIQHKNVDTSYLQAINKKSLKDYIINLNPPQEALTPQNIDSYHIRQPVFDTPEKSFGSNNTAQNENEDEDKISENQKNYKNNEEKESQNKNHTIVNDEIKKHDIILPNITQIQSLPVINLLTDKKANDSVPNINISNTRYDLNETVQAGDNSPLKISSQKKLKRLITRDQKYISSILHEYQETHDPDSAKLKKKKSLRKQGGDWLLKKIFTPKSGGLIFKAYEYILYYLFPIGKIKKKKQQLEYTLDKINDKLDAVFIINKLIEIDKLKILVLNENQLKLFDYMPKPVINNRTQYKQQLQQAENSIKGLSLKLKSTSQQEECKFKQSWGILDSEKTTLMKAHEAYTAFNKIKDGNEDISIIDQKLISMLDPQILNYFEKTRQQLYYQKIVDNTLHEEDNIHNKGITNFQIMSNQVIQQQSENIKYKTSMFQIQGLSNEDLDNINKMEMNYKTYQNQCLTQIPSEQLSEQYQSEKPQSEIQNNNNGSEKSEIIFNESIDVAHESYLQNKTVFKDFVPNKGLNLSII